MQGKQKIALFLGGDIVAHLIMSKVVPIMVANGFEPILFYPKHKPSNNPNAQHKDIQDYAFMERHLLRNTVFKFLRDEPENHAPFTTPNAIAAQHNLHMEEVENVNDPAFVKRLASIPNLAGGLSIRCFQMFRQDITSLLKERGFFLNLHPGLLPEFRGVYSTLREMATGSDEIGVTLHHIDPFVQGSKDRYAGIDTGNILSVKSRHLPDDRSLYTNNLTLVELAEAAIEEMIRDLRQGRTLRGHPQTLSEEQYFSYPTAGELADWKNRGIVMYDREEVITHLVDLFTRPGTRHSNTFEDVVRDSVRSYFNRSANGAPAADRRACARTDTTPPATPAQPQATGYRRPGNGGRNLRAALGYT